MNSTLVAASVSRSTGNVLGWIVRLVTALSIFDWILVGVAVMLVMWGWVRAAAFARLGTIAVEDVGADGATLTPIAIKAELQQALGERGLLLPSGVPSGSPTKADLSNAMAGSGAPQAAWLAALINLIPVPATKTSFMLTATIMTDDTKPNEKLGLLYQLVCTGPAPNVTLADVRGPTWPAVIDQVSKDVYRQIAQDAPAIYPKWARWKSTAGLTKFADGLNIERGSPTYGQPLPLEPGKARLDAAADCYQAASQEDPDNMLVRLRLANCLERQAGLAEEEQARVRKLVRALQAYTSIRHRQPDIFEAGYRASVLLSTIAESHYWDGAGQTPTEVEDVVTRLETDRIRTIVDRIRTIGRIRTIVDRIGTIGRRSVTETAANAADSGSDKEVRARARRAARRESRLARHRLWAPYTILFEGRFRHRFEPTGRDRRHLRKALRISKLCIKARNARTMKTWRLNCGQLLWRALLFSMLGLRPYDAGWQANYNAASFYALVIEALNAQKRTVWIRTKWIERLALRHLRLAIDQAGPEELQCRYVRDEDPDLRALRELKDFKRELAQLCPDELILHVSRKTGDAEWSSRVWTLHVWDGAQETAWDKPLYPFSPSREELKFRVRIRDENEPVRLILHIGDEKKEPEERSIPPLPRGPEAWLYLDQAPMTRTRPADWPLDDQSTTAPAEPG